jgi:hypothetical protein
MLNISDHNKKEGKDLDDINRFSAKQYRSKVDIKELPNKQANIYNRSQDRSIDA